MKDRIKEFMAERLRKIYSGRDEQQAVLNGAVVAIPAIPITGFALSIGIGPAGGLVLGGLAGAIIGSYVLIQFRKSVNQLLEGEG